MKKLLITILTLVSTSIFSADADKIAEQNEIKVLKVEGAKKDLEFQVTMNQLNEAYLNSASGNGYPEPCKCLL